MSRWRDRAIGFIVGALFCGVLWTLAGRAEIATERGGAGSPPADRSLRNPDPAARTGADSTCWLGVVIADEIDVVARVDGRVTETLAEVGDSVATGEALVRLDASEVQHELDAARADLEAARAESQARELDRRQAESEGRRAETLDEVLSEREAEQVAFAAERARHEADAALANVSRSEARVRQLSELVSRARVEAPFTGEVARRYVEVGQVVGRETPLFRLVGTGHRRVRFAVPPSEASDLTVDGDVLLYFAEAASATPAVVSNVSPEIDPASEMVVVEAVLASQNVTAPVGESIWVRAGSDLAAPPCRDGGRGAIGATEEANR